MDALMADRKKFHKSCFCCEHCGSKLSLGNYVSLHGQLFCLHHYKQLPKSKGCFNNGVGKNLPFPSPDQLNWRYSISSLDKDTATYSQQTQDRKRIKTIETKHSCNKITTVWPPTPDTPKTPFKFEKDMQLTKTQWPPQDITPISPKHQHRKAVPRSVL